MQPLPACSPHFRKLYNRITCGHTPFIYSLKIHDMDIYAVFICASVYIYKYGGVLLISAYLSLLPALIFIQKEEVLKLPLRL